PLPALLPLPAALPISDSVASPGAHGDEHVLLANPRAQIFHRDNRLAAPALCGEGNEVGCAACRSNGKGIVPWRQNSIPPLCLQRSEEHTSELQSPDHI